MNHETTVLPALVIGPMPLIGRAAKITGDVAMPTSVTVFDGDLMKRVTGTESRVCADIAARQAKGIAKYGTTVQDNPLALREWLQHAYEECLDQAVYLKRAIEELGK